MQDVILIAHLRIRIFPLGQGQDAEMGATGAEMIQAGSVAQSDVASRALFIVGCPRSGTTWVQLLMAQHAGVATAPETQIFAYYLEQFERQWRHELAGRDRGGQGGAGLSRLLSQPDFDALCRLVACTVLEKIAARNPSAEILVEKSPKHALTASMIRRVLPEARFLHVIRDPRDTAASVMAAGRSWGSGWAPQSAVGAARLWLSSLEGAYQVADGPGYREVRYEDMRADPVAELHGIAEWLGLSWSAEDRAAAVAACDLPRLQKNASGANLPVPGEQSPSGFFGKGGVGSFKQDLSRSEVRIIEHICREAMDRLGYHCVGGGMRRGAIRVRAHDAVNRVRESIDWQLTKLLRHV